MSANNLDPVGIDCSRWGRCPFDAINGSARRGGTTAALDLVILPQTPPGPPRAAGKPREGRPPMPTVLIADDETPHLQALEKIFVREGFTVVCAQNGRQALEALRAAAPVHLVVTDLMMPEMNGLDLLKAARAVSPETEVILMTAFGTVEKAVEAMKAGAYDFVTKPIKRAVLMKSARKALERQALVAENRSLKAQLAGLQTERSIIGSSPPMRELVEMLKQVAPSRATVLLTGKSGTGKELFARAIHDLSDRRDGPFVAVNCAALPEAIMEAELFGTEPGAFTGSHRRQGRFEAASGGTLFLDEIGDVPPTVQVKLLRALQEGEIVRLGTNTPIHIDCRVVAATHKRLDDEIKAGNFREDLYYRLHVVALHLPPLSERPDDIPLLTGHFIRRYAERDGRTINGITREAQEALAAYPWPGNVRELENSIERAIVMDKDNVIGVDDLPSRVSASEKERRSITIPLGTSLEDIEVRVIHETLRMTGGDKRLAAQLLGIATRTIYRKL